MKELRQWLALLIGKGVFLFLRFFGFSATAAPGLIAQKIYPSILEFLASQLKYSLIICGTNGKTTTARLLAAVLKNSQINFIHNRLGSNLERGIISEILKNFSFKKKLNQTIGLWEVDEATLPLIIKKINPKGVIFTNLFRDQLDRYGEIDILAQKWQESLKNLKKNCWLILNADDANLIRIGKENKIKTIYFGLRDFRLGNVKIDHTADALFCPFCFSLLKYQKAFVSHLGIYRCPQCGNIQPFPQVKIQKVVLNKKERLKIKISCRQKVFWFTSPLIGTYNLYNLMAAFSAAFFIFKIEPSLIIKSFENFVPPFGRFEKISLVSKNLYIFLVKNPAGFNEILKTIFIWFAQKPLALFLALNDLNADGRDVSWIWDVDFTHLKKLKNIKKFFIGGTRLYDMALRLKYADFSPSFFQIDVDLEKNLNKFLSFPVKNLIILPTYTALLKIRQLLNQKGISHSLEKD